MLSLELLDEIISKSKKSISIDKDLMKKIIIDVIEKEDNITKNKFNGIIFEHINWKNTCCCHSSKTGMISIDYNKLITKKQSDDDLINNLVIVQLLLHEVQHAKEISKLRKKNLESYLLKLSDLKIIENISVSELKLMKKFLNMGLFKSILDMKYKKVYIKLYDLIPAERIAQIDSYKYLLDSLSKYPNFKNNYHNVIERLYFAYINEYLVGYNLQNKNLSIPLFYYLNSVTYVSEEQRNFIYKKLNCLSNEESLDFEDKMKYGFETNDGEIEKLYYKNLKYIE